MSDVRFPSVSGYNLQRRRIDLPGGLQGQVNLLIVPFQRWQQDLVDTWIPLLTELEQLFPGLAYYELPTIYRMNLLSRTLLNEGMRAGIPNQKARDRTITLYLDTAEFRRSLVIESEATITLLLIDRAGQVLWRTTGAYDEGEARRLALALAGQIPPAFESLWTRS
ncbi:MAG: hypothetical protein ACKOC5_02710 [Chloroflexota bacterium]